MNYFYVYKLLRPWNNVPCYVGKGCGGRSSHHAKLGAKHYNKHLASIYRKAGDTPVPVEIVASGLTEDAAFALEIKLIAEIGRADQGKGPLANWTDGGEGTTAISDDTRAKRSMSISAAWTDDRREALRERNASHVYSEESLLKLRTRPKRIMSDEEKERRRAYWTPERRAERAALMTSERRASMSATVKASFTQDVIDKRNARPSNI